MYHALNIVLQLLLATSLDCATARNHQHDRFRDAEMTVASWSGCTVTGTIDGVSTSLFMDVTGCALRAKVPSKLRVRYDQTCGAIVEITDGPGITTPMPPPCPVQTPSPTPSSTTESTSGTRGAEIIDKDGNRWTLGAQQQTLRNGAHASGGFGSVYKYVAQVVYTLGTDNRWYRWTGSGWQGTEFLGANEPGGSAQPTPSPTATPTPTPTPSPAPSPAPSPPPSPRPTPPSRYIYEGHPWNTSTTSAARAANLKLVNDMGAQGWKLVIVIGNTAYFEKVSP